MVFQTNYFILRELNVLNLVPEVSDNGTEAMSSIFRGHHIIRRTSIKKQIIRGKSKGNRNRRKLHPHTLFIDYIKQPI